MPAPLFMLADAAPSADFTLNALLLSVLLVQVLTFFRTPKREVKMEEAFATRDELNEVRADFKALSAKIDEVKTSLESKGEERKESLEGKMARMQETIGQIAVAIAHLEEKQ